MRSITLVGVVVVSTACTGKEPIDLGLTKRLSTTEEAIMDLTNGLPADRAIKVQSILRRYLGWTWKAALDAHSLEAPLLAPTGGP